MKKILFLLCFCLSIRSIEASDNGAASSSSSQTKKDYVSIPIYEINETKPLIGTKDLAAAFTQTIYGKPCDKEKFCTKALRDRLKHLQEHDPQTFNALYQHLNQSNNQIAQKRSLDLGTLAQNTVSQIAAHPEMVQQLLKAWKAQHNEQKQTIEQHNGTITNQEETIATQGNDLKTTRYKFYATTATTILGIIATIVTALLTTNQC